MVLRERLDGFDIVNQYRGDGGRKEEDRRLLQAGCKALARGGLAAATNP